MTGAGAQQTATTAANLFIKVLEVEVHEKTLCHTLEMLALWGAKFYNEIPKNVIDAFKVSHFKTINQTNYLQRNFCLEWHEFENINRCSA